MSRPQEDKESERFYSLSYFIIPIPMIAGLVFAAYTLLTEDSRNLAYCVIAKHANVYQTNTLNPDDFEYREAITLDICKDKDDAIDNNDGRLKGRVHWFVCKGTTCGTGWTNHLAQPQSHEDTK